MSLIPQSPDLFAGTVRYNLDPFDCFSSDELCAALEDAQLGKLRLDDMVRPASKAAKLPC